MDHEVDPLDLAEGIRKVGDAGALGFGVNVSVEVPGGMVEVTCDVVSSRWP